MQKSIKISFFSLALWVIFPISAMQEEDVKDWRNPGVKQKPSMNSPVFTRASRRRSFSSDDGRLSAAEKRAQQALMPPRHSYTKEELAAMQGSADKCSKEVIVAVERFKASVLSKSQ